ncbi:hypothetical protein U1Q18_016515 [Sarracenia purpurea var. burkii]
MVEEEEGGLMVVEEKYFEGVPVDKLDMGVLGRVVWWVIILFLYLFFLCVLMVSGRWVGWEATLMSEVVGGGGNRERCFNAGVGSGALMVRCWEDVLDSTLEMTDQMYGPSGSSGDCPGLGDGPQLRLTFV